MPAPHRSGTPARRPVRRRRVPPHVFWVRRAVVLGVVGGLVWAAIGLVGLLDLSMHNGEPARANTTGADTDDTDDADDADADDDAEKQKSRKERRAARIARLAADAADPGKEPGKPMPTGPCADSDVVVTPTVPDGHAGGPVEIVLELTTLDAAACSWQVDPESVFVTITKGTTTLWSSQHCPRALPEAAVVPRQETPDRVRFDWSGKESQPGCTVATDWVWPGTYTINAVARGSVKAVEASFALGHPEPAPAPETEPDTRAERREARREARQEQRAEADARDEAREEAREQAEREQARRDALEQAREAKREERSRRQQERRAERRQEREAEGRRSGSGG